MKSQSNNQNQFILFVWLDLNKLTVKCTLLLARQGKSFPPIDACVSLIVLLSLWDELLVASFTVIW